MEDHLKLHSFSENAKEDNKDDRSEAGDTGSGTFSVDIQCTMCKKDFFDKHALRIHMQVRLIFPPNDDGSKEYM